MKLELKHLAAYLPYNLGIKVDGYDCILIGIGESNVLFDGLEIEGRGMFSKIKPILSPINCISKEITVNGNTFIPIVELLKIRFAPYFEQKKGSVYSLIDQDENSAWFRYQATFAVKISYFKDDIFSYPPHWIIEKLFEWHIDFYGLIEAGLAVEK